TERRAAENPLVLAVGDAVREVRAAAGDQLCRQWAPVGTGNIVGEESAQRFEIDAFRTPHGHAGQPMRAFGDASGDARGAGPYGAAGALRVARHPTDGHVDAEPGGGALFLRLPAPVPRLRRPASPR